jgi:hypothetical protein
MDAKKRKLEAGRRVGEDCTGCAYWIRWIRRRRGLGNCTMTANMDSGFSAERIQYVFKPMFDRGGAAQSSIYRPTRGETDTMQMSSTTSWTVPRQFQPEKGCWQKVWYGCTRRTTTAPVQFEKGRKMKLRNSIYEYNSLYLVKPTMSIATCYEESMTVHSAEW